MADSGVREIQLTGKQLVFLFMASVVLIVSVFLLGVSVGRGVRGTQVMAEAATPPPATTTEPPVPVPANTPGASDATTYHTALPAGGAQATPPASTPEPAATPAAPPKANPAPPPSTPPAAPPPAAASTTSTPPATTSTKTTTPAKPPATGNWFIQVEAFRSKDSADSVAAKLKAKGFPVSIVDAPKPLYRVRVGPYAQRSDADAAVEKIKKDGFSSAYVTH